MIAMKLTNRQKIARMNLKTARSAELSVSIEQVIITKRAYCANLLQPALGVPVPNSKFKSVLGK